MKHETSPDSRSQASAVDTLQEAGEMPPGARRTDALKRAGMLRRVADSHELIFEKEAGPGSGWSQRKLSLPRLDATAVTPRSNALDRALSLIAAFIVVAIITVARY